jgi:hypothetical protein
MTVAVATDLVQSIGILLLGLGALMHYTNDRRHNR